MLICFAMRCVNLAGQVLEEVGPVGDEIQLPKTSARFVQTQDDPDYSHTMSFE